MTDRDPRPGDTAAGDSGAPDVVDVEGRTRQRTVTLLVIAVVLLAIVGAALVLGSDDEPADVPVPTTAAEPPGVTGDPDPKSPPSTPEPADPDELPIPADEARAECSGGAPPPQPPTATAPDDTGPLVDFTPSQAIACIHLSGRLTDIRALSEDEDLTRITEAVQGLELVPEHIACTAEAGPDVELVLLGEGHRARIWLQLYGCGLAHDGDGRIRMGAKSLGWLTGD